MTSAVIQLDHLSKTYIARKSRVEALKDICLDIAPHQVFGFLGPNGAGKSTTIRLILDLIRPTDGRVLIGGVEVRRNSVTAQSMGAIVEAATFYGYLSGTDNLRLLARTTGLDVNQIPELIAQVKLTGHEKRLVRDYSTGMKQRLGIAAALLGNPSLLILDEPTNGLDPAGIHEMRLFLRRLVDEQNKTVILSSHILSEVELLCDRVAILNHGRIAREGAVHTMLNDSAHLLLEVHPAAGAIAALQAHWPATCDAPEKPRGWITVSASNEDAPAVVRHLTAAGVDIYQLKTHNQSLEDFFLETTSNEVEDV